MYTFEVVETISPAHVTQKMKIFPGTIVAPIPACSLLLMDVVPSTRCLRYSCLSAHLQEGQAFAKQNGLDYFETSAAAAKDVDTPFQHMASNFHET